MKTISRKTLLRTLLPALAVSLLAACSSTPDNSDLASVDATGTSGVPKLSAAALAKLRDPNSPLSKRSVYFGYDQYDVQSEYRNQLQAHAKFIASEPNARVLIQGNTDDRGS
ncbi:MAG: peptidoglycan-associated lipoprotein, partial [Fluviibacter sp.]